MLPCRVLAALLWPDIFMRMVILAFGRSACRTLCAALLTISMIVGADAADALGHVQSAHGQTCRG